jgi:tight adherence protein B
MKEYILLGSLIFLALIIIIELARYGFRNIDSVRRARIKKRIKRYTYEADKESPLDIVKTRVLSDISFINTLLNNIPFVKKLDQLTIQANVKQSFGFFLMLSLLIGILLFWGTARQTQNQAIGVVAGLLGLTLPYIYLVIVKKKRVEKFRTQLPEALDLMARALQAGHALSGSMKLAADEFSDPLSTEFAETLDEVNFGVDMPRALTNLTDRIDCPEVRYFVVALILQRETGGNLAELLEKLAEIMRKKFEFQGKVRSLIAEGKFSAVILIMLPFLMAFYMQINTPGYLNIMFEHPMGQTVMIVCGVLMFVGAIVLIKMVDIEV